jgi:hypothetical protein
MRFAWSTHLFLAIVAMCLAIPATARDSEIGRFVSESCFEHRGRVGSGKHITLCFDDGGNLRGADFDGAHGSEITGRWVANTDIIIGDITCRMTITSSTSMVLAGCYYQGHWTRTAQLPKD